MIPGWELSSICVLLSATEFDACKMFGAEQVMAPFTPFFCESMYQNLRRALPGDAPRSVHWCDFPEAVQAQVRNAYSFLSVVTAMSHQNIAMPCTAFTACECDTSSS